MAAQRVLIVDVIHLANNDSFVYANEPQMALRTRCGEVIPALLNFLPATDLREISCIRCLGDRRKKWSDKPPT